MLLPQFDNPTTAINFIFFYLLDYLNLKDSNVLGTFVSTLSNLYKAEAKSKDLEISP